MAEAPHITIGHHPNAGVVAAPSHEHHVTDYLLRRVGFEPLPNSRLYALTEPGRDPVRRTQLAVQSLRTARQNVHADAAYDLRPGQRPPQPIGPPDDEVRELRNASSMADIIRQGMNEKIDSVEELDDLVDCATDCFDRLDSAKGRDMAVRLRNIKPLVTSLHDHLTSAVRELEDMSRGVFKNAPTPSDIPPREGHKELPEHHASRSRAATASAPQRPGPTPQSALPQSLSGSAGTWQPPHPLNTPPICKEPAPCP
ncbi:hypothetical protein [Streptomyces sulphureus]|uniref:hypothetical protein n=1 Tax=Streptomyces sulphureus TaxID=47758 RepID=UPI0003A20107|nr:hypothetical protein [Streptomyces sulphureus]